MSKKIKTLSKPLSPKRAIGIYILTSLFLVFEMAVQVSPSVMANNLMHDLHLGAFALGLMSGFYFYTYTAMQIPSGLLFDRFKPRIIITTALLICSLGALIFGFANNYYFGCAARLLIGFGSAFAFLSALVVASDLFHSKLFALLTGVTQMLAAFGAMIGQMPVSFLVENLGWRNTCFLLSAIGAMLALTVWVFMDYEKITSHITCQFPSTPNILNSLKKIISNPQSWLIALYACLLWAPMSGFASLWGVPFLMKADGLSANSAALYSSIMWLGLAVFSPLLGIFASVINNKWLTLVISAIIGTISFGLILEVQLSPGLLGACLFLAGGACAGQAISFALVKDNNTHAAKGAAISFNNMAVVIAGAIFQPLIGHLISARSIHLVNNYTLSDYKRGLFTIWLTYIAAVFISFFCIKEKKSTSSVLKEKAAEIPIRGALR